MVYVRGVSVLVRARGCVCVCVCVCVRVRDARAGVCAVLCLELTRTILNATIKVLYSDVRRAFQQGQLRSVSQKTCLGTLQYEGSQIFMQLTSVFTSLLMVRRLIWAGAEVHA